MYSHNVGNMKTLDLKKEYALLSFGLYKDIEQRVEAVSVAMALISLCVHHRAPIFGTDEQAGANYVFVTHQMASDLTASIAESLPYAGAFDFSAHREATSEHAYDVAKDVNGKLQDCTKGLINVADDGEISEALIPNVAPEEEAKNCFISLHKHMLEMHDIFNENAKQLKERAQTLSEGIESLQPTLKQGLSHDFGKLRFLVILCANHGLLAQDHKGRMEKAVKPAIP